MSFLLEVKAYNVAKSEHSWKQGIGCKTTKELVKIDVERDKKQTGDRKTGKAKESTNKIEISRKVSTKVDKQTKEINKQSKQAFKQTWTDLENNEEELVEQDIPDNFKKFTTQERKIVLEKPK